MLDQSLLQSHFIGRDGFRWWIGQIPEIKHWIENSSDGGWGQRYKVRILGYHPLDDKELEDADLPWAQVMLPVTAGTGAANVATGTQLQQGDIVIGFFLDGDNAQIPLIMGALGRTKLWSTAGYKNPWQTFTGFSDPIPKNNKQTPSEINQSTSDSQRSPASVTDQQAQQLSQKVGEQVVSENSSIGDKIPLANTVKNTQVDKIKSVIQNLLKKLKNLQGDIEKIRTEIDKAADKVVALCDDFVGGIFNFLINGNQDKGGKFIGLVGLLKEGLNLLYKSVFAQVLAATGNPVAAHLAGVAAQQAMVIPVKNLEQAFSCIAGAAMSGLKYIVSEIIGSVVDNVSRFTSCAADQFAGSLLSSIVGVLENLLNGPLDTVAKLLQFFSDFSVGNLMREAIGLLSEFGVGFACNQNLNDFKGLVNEWIVGGGASGSTSTLASSMANSYGAIKDIANIVNSGVDINSVQQCFTDALQFASPPIINIFGGGGSGASAIPIYGNLVTDTSGNTTASIIGVQVTNPGSGYTFPPFVEIVDDNDQGYGAVARSVINANGELESIYVVSEGENYSVGNIEEYSVLNVLIEDGGNGYKDAIVTDNLGNNYDSQIVDGRIYQVTPLNNVVDALPVLTVNSNTGNGAILRPLLGAPKFTGEVQKVVDCVT